MDNKITPLEVYTIANLKNARSEKDYCDLNSELLFLDLEINISFHETINPV
jgi:hypothetical protein